MKKLFVLVAALFAVCSLSAQDLKTVFNEGGAAYTAKNFQLAAEKFEQVTLNLLTIEDHLADTLAYSVRILDSNLIYSTTETASHGVFLPL